MKTMRKFMLASVALLAVASCQKEMANEPEASFDVFTVTASIGADTKTVLDDTAEGNKIYWTPGDAISIFDNEGNSVKFTTDIDENETSATFNNSVAFTEPDAYLAVYPDRGEGIQKYAGGIINNFRISTPQKAIAGSFDPEFAGAIGLPKEPGSKNLEFKNIHSLIKFTIGGDVAPTSVTLVNDAGKMIAGLYKYDVVNDKVINEGAASEITLSGNFVAGETYYIAVIPYDYKTTLTLKFDSTPVKTSKQITLQPNKIYNFGTVEQPEVVLEPELVKAFQSHGNNSYMTALGGREGKDRNIAIDGDYVYIPETDGTPVMWKVSLTDGTASKMPVSTVATGGTFALSCPRMLKNEDANVNGGKDILVVSSMGMNGEETYLYFYKNGIDADPHKVALHNGGNINKRLGDKMSIYGTMQNWGAYFKEQGTSAIINWGGTANVLNVDNIWPAGRNYMDPTSDANMGGIYFYDYASAGKKGLITTVENGKYGVLDNSTTYDEGGKLSAKPVYVAQTWSSDPSLAGCHGFNFFKHNGRDYIAYTSLSTKKLYIIKGAASADGVQAALEAKDVVFEANIAANDNTCASGNSAADCSVYQKDGVTYVAGHIQNVGVVVYKLM